MIKSIEVSGKTEDEAIAAALGQLGVERDAVSVEVLERAKSGFFGIGSSPAVVRVSYEYKESKVEATENFLTGLFQRIGVQATPQVVENEAGGIDVTVVGENVGSIIGRRGETLDAIQHLTNYVVNKGSGNRVRVSIDAENYRAKRDETLVKLANKTAAKALKFRRNITLEPMNAYERHVIHTALQEYNGVTTYSTGTEPNRRIVVAYERGQSEDRERGRSSFRRRVEEQAPVQEVATAAEEKEEYVLPDAPSKYESREWS